MPRLRPLGAAALAAVLTSVAARPCINKCSGHGICETTSRKCLCFEGYRGYDCRDRVCPKGRQWFGYPNAIDSIHDVETECSGAGTCDKSTGECKCLDEFEGFACQYMKCANDCSGHGRCLSMKDAASEINGHSLLRSVQYSTPWDADMVRGCACDFGWEGYDCSLRTCEKGDDPLTAGQQDEVQYLNCTCPYDECTGHMVLSFYGQHSPRINATAVLGRSDESTASLASGLAVGESVEAKLEVIRPLDGVAVTADNTSVTGWHGRSPLCAPASQGGALTRIRFDEHGGDVPALGIISSVLGRDNATGATASASISLFHNGQLGSVRGTTERDTCSNRGVCNHLTGDCLCFANYFASDGDGASGFRPDCGYASVNVSDCPNGIDRCSGRGVCDHQRIINGSLFEVDEFDSFVNETFLFKCTCYNGYHGGDCSLQTCPMAPAWFDEASEDNVAHALAECSAMGHCDTATGECRCRPGFTGEACERMTCPLGANGKECNNKGRCLTLRQAAANTVRHGFRPGADEVQTITCSLTDTSFYLELNHHRTFPISSNASASVVRSLIEELPSVGLVTVTFNPGAVACLSSGNTITVTFTNHDLDTEQFIATSPEGVSNAGLSVSTVSDASRLTYGETPGVTNTWDADKLTMCDCDGRPDYNKTRPTTATYSNYTHSENYVGYTGAGMTSEVDLGLFVGPVCEQRPCPTGPDPLNGTRSLGVLESQAITCTSPSVVGGNVSGIKLVHMGLTTTTLEYNSTASQVQLALERLESVGRVQVNMTEAAFCTSAGTVTNVTFLTEFGDLPEIRTVITDGEAVTIAVAESVKGTRHNVECNERGVCDGTTGLCQCFDGFVSGDGAQGQGRRGDCGGMDDLFRNGA